MNNRRWAVQIKKDDFFSDMWGWEAMPFIDETTLGDAEFGGSGCRSEVAAKEMAQEALVKRGITRAVLLGADDLKTL